MNMCRQYKKKLQVVIREDLFQKDDRPGVVQKYLESLDANDVRTPVERRQGVRMDVNLPAIIHVQKEGNEVVYVPAIIKNISTSGVLLEVEDKGHILVNSTKDIESFMISFCVPGEDEPVVVECQPKRIEFRELVGVGAQFSSLGFPDQRYVM